MRILIPAFALVFTFFSCFSEPPIGAVGRHPPRELRPYDPQRAGATIVEVFDITYVMQGQVVQNIAMHGDRFYVHVGTALHIFDRHTLQKTGTTDMDFPGAGIPTGTIRMNDFGMAITGGRALLLGLDRTVPQPPFLLSVDLSSGTVLLPETASLPFSGQNVIFRRTLVGYDASNGLVWFRVSDYTGNIRFHFFEYDEGTHVFTPRGVREAPFLVGRNDRNPAWWAFIHGDYVLYPGYVRVSSSPPLNVGIDRRHIDRPGESLHFIDTEYLNTLSIPKRIVYDPPYIWFIVRRNNRVEMLKLLPHTGMEGGP